MQKLFKAIFLSTCLIIKLCSPALAEEKKLNIYNWSDYIAPDTIKKFEEETGIDVIYDVFDSNEILEAKLFSGNTGYDIVAPTAIPFLARQINANVLLPLDKSLLKNYNNLDPIIMKQLESADPENKHAIPWMWGTTGFGYNVEKIKEILPNAPTDSLAMFYDKEVISKLSQCGVSILDTPDDVIPTTLAYLGHGLINKENDKLKQAANTLKNIRPFVKYFHSSQYINDLANGDLCLAMGWSGDILQARDRAKEANQNFTIDYVIPKEGSVIWVDVLAIPKTAPHPKNAHLFLDFIMRPEIAADQTNEIAYANGNAKSLEYIEQDIKNDPGIYPSEKLKQTFKIDILTDEQYYRTRTRAWTKMKTGR